MWKEDWKCKEMRKNEIDRDIQKQVSDLLYVQKMVTERILNEVTELLRGRGRENNEIKESLKDILDERLR